MVISNRLMRLGSKAGDPTINIQLYLAKVCVLMKTSVEY